MKIQTVIAHSSELLRIVSNSTQPTDNFLSDYFRKKKYFGSKERKFASNLIYFALRNLTLLKFFYNLLKERNNLISTKNEFESICYIALMLCDYFPEEFPDFNPNELIEKIEQEQSTESILQLFFANDFENISSIIKDNFTKIQDDISNLKLEDILISKENRNLLINRYSFPEYLLESILKNFTDINSLINLLKNSIKQAPISIRVNLRNSDIISVINSLKASEIKPICSQISSVGLILNKRVQLNELEVYKSGKIEIQDIGSQLISLVLDPLETDNVLDACAGAGGKSLHIADLQNDRGKIIANDIEFHRLKEIPKRAFKNGVKSIQIHHFNLKTKQNKLIELNKGNLFDKVIVDAPCSGSGTIRRNPIRKFQINERLIGKLNENQLNILEFYSKYLKNGGILLYSTCSILPQENSELITKFLQRNPNFIPEDVRPTIQKSNINKVHLLQDYMISTDFREDETDGFFIAKLRKLN
jgi:16S rRNA (cytosine967-C5)-methyltransferase